MKSLNDLQTYNYQPLIKVLFIWQTGSTYNNEEFKRYIHSLISGANCFILQIPMLYLGFFTLDVHIITLGFASGNNVNVSGK